MRSFTTIIATVLTAIIAVDAGSQHVPMGNYARHHAAVVRRTPAPIARSVDAPNWSRRSLSRRCKPKGVNTPKPATPAPSTGGNGGNTGNGGNNGGSPNNGGSGGSSGGNGGGSSGGSGGSGGSPNGSVINFSWNGACPVNPDPNPGNSVGPNGDEGFLNCGLHSGGWNPPNVKMSDLVYKDLRTAINEPGSPFTACSSLIDSFETVANELNIPAILLASFAMQESTCNPGAQGGAGEIGLMQVTPDKCIGDCWNAENNLRIGANYFKNVLDSHNGNVLLSIGEYNGFFQGMTPDDVVNRPCPQQQNLDYLHHMTNHWMQNRDPNGAGTERNKQACGGY